MNTTAPWSKAECQSLEGTLDDAPDGSWACCFEVIRQCWSCAMGASTATNRCACRGSGCPPEAKIERLYRAVDRHEPNK